MSIITDNIDRILKERGMAKKDFYAKLEITAAAYSQWRLEQSQPSITKLYTAADILGVDIADIVSSKKRTATEIGDGVSASTRLMASIFETLSEEDQWSILLQAQAKARSQKCRDARPKAE